MAFRTPEDPNVQPLNPFGVNYDEAPDHDLVRRSLSGDREALGELLKRHQPFAYNVALKMVRDPDHAWDITQEALLKVVTHLASFRFEASFRTWLYRIVLNHFLGMKRRGCEEKVVDFEQFSGFLDALPNPALTPAEEVELKEEIADGRVRCMSGMLLCLSREQRLVFVLAELFGVGDTLGGELLQITPGNFRVRLHRARRDLYTFMERKCGLVNKANPCRCRSKTKALIDAGLVDRRQGRFGHDLLIKVEAFARQRVDQVQGTLEERYATLYRAHPFDTTEGKTALAELLASTELDDLFRLESAD